jgi:CheY-like chemotaxis protein
VSRRVLVVDDEDDIRAIVRLSLERLAGWTVVEAPSGQAAAALAAEQPFDAVLLDMMMPLCDGEATARLLRADPATRDVPILLLSAAVDPPDWAAALGVRGLLTKPFDPARLPETVAAALGW